MIRTDTFTGESHVANYYLYNVVKESTRGAVTLFHLGISTYSSFNPHCKKHDHFHAPLGIKHKLKTVSGTYNLSHFADTIFNSTHQ